MGITVLRSAGLTPIKLFLDERNVRAWPGGVGDCKVGSNYAPTILPQTIAHQTHGTPQVGRLRFKMRVQCMGACTSQRLCLSLEGSTSCACHVHVLALTQGCMYMENGLQTFQ